MRLMMGMMRLRLTTPADAESVGRVLSAAYGDLLASDYAPETLAAIVPLISRAKPELLASGTYFAVVEDDAIISVGGWTPLKPGTGERIPGVGHVRHVATDPARLRKGAARLLMRHVLQDALLAGMEHMECLSTLTAEPFYAVLGFTRVAESTVMIGGHAFPCIDMRLALSPRR
jgi:predicted N-acetyltransferase YhbS